MKNDDDGDEKKKSGVSLKSLLERVLKPGGLK